MEAAVAKPGASSQAARPETSTVERAARGDTAAFGDLYAAHLDSIYRHVRFRVRDAETAADITQEVFLKAYRSLDALRQPERFHAWLLQIANNCVINDLRRRTELPAEAEIERQPDPAASPEAAAAHQLNLDRVMAATAGLTDLQRQVVALRFVSGLSVSETASIMGRKPNAIHNLQHSALAALRRRLNPAEPER